MTAATHDSERVCTLWVHDDSFSKEDAILNLSAFSPPVKDGLLLSVVPTQSNVAVHDFQGQHAADDNDRGAPRFVHPSDNRQSSARASSRGRLPLESDASPFLFRASPIPGDLKSKVPNLQLSVSGRIARLFGFKNRTSVVLTIILDESKYSASHVEITFRDVQLTRQDMWEIATAQNTKPMYRGQQLSFPNANRTAVKALYIRGKKVPCAVFTAKTAPIFRSESARFVLYIQMSKEMWDFDLEGFGEVMFYRVINGFLPELFQRWAKMSARHLVSIVLFSRMEYDPSESVTGASIPDQRRTPAGSTYQDYYRVVMSEMLSGDWSLILQQLRKEFKNYLRDISIRNGGSSVDEETDGIGPQQILGRTSPAIRGNVLEAINLAFAQFPDYYVDQDLTRAGLSVVLVSPGNGVFEVNEDLLRLTTENLVSKGGGVDIVCLSRKPLHTVPLFKYRNPRVKDDILAALREPVIPTSDSAPSSYPDKNHVTSASVETLKASIGSDSFASSSREDMLFALPHWCNVSFYARSPSKHQDDTSKFDLGTGADIDSFLPRCSMYEIQMMGLMDSEMCNISLPYLRSKSNSAYAIAGSHEWPEEDRSRLGITSITNTFSHTVTEGSRSRRDEYTSGDLIHNQTERKMMEVFDEKAFSTPTTVSAYGLPSMSLAKTIPAVAENAKPITAISKPIDIGRPSRQSSFGGDSLAEDAVPSSMKLTSTPEQVPPSSIKNTEEIPTARKSSKREVSMASRLLGVPGRMLAKAEPSTSSSYEPASSSIMVTKSQEEASKLPNEKRAVSQQVRTTLSRQSSTQAPESLVAFSASKPKTIQRPSSSRRSGSPESVQYTRQASRSRTPNANEQGSLGRASVVDSIIRSGQKTQSQSRPKPRPRQSVEQQHLSPWIIVANPSQRHKWHNGIRNRFDVWSPFLSRTKKDMKWRSLCSPAILPLTTEIIVDLENCEESPHKIALHEDEQLADLPKARRLLMGDLISNRLHKGFQIVTEAKGSTSPGEKLAFDEQYLGTDGATVLLTKGRLTHRICATDSEIAITRYKRKTPEDEILEKSSAPRHYNPLIRTALADGYDQHSFTLSLEFTEQNWSAIDNILAGYEMSQALETWCARFVFIPVDPPSSKGRPNTTMADDTEDEVRIEGIQRLTQLWEKLRSTAQEDRPFQISSKRRRDPNPFDLEFQTRDASAVVAAGFENSLLAEPRSNTPATQLFNKNESYRTTDKLDLQTLADDLQSAGGLNIKDRRWYLRIHPDCFIGFELTWWLQQNFKDVESREDAVKLGNKLLEQGLFEHVTGKHAFRDGNFFYAIAPRYRSTKSEARSNWFSRKGDKSVPPTPAPSSTQEANPVELAVESDSVRPSTPRTKKRPQVRLTEAVKLDLDQRKKSVRSRPEIINLHYDKLYNPDSCYHIAVEFVDTTRKLVDDFLYSWSQTAERYGLRMAQVPLRDVHTISGVNQFRSPFTVRLVWLPPDIGMAERKPSGAMSEKAATEKISSTPSTPQMRPVAASTPAAMMTAPMAASRHMFQKSILRRFNFVVDHEAASNFPLDVDIKSTFPAQTEYTYTQYVHKTGVLLVQIDEKGDFLLLTNQLHITRHGTNQGAGSTNTGSGALPGKQTDLSGSANLSDSRRPPSSMATMAPSWSPLSSPYIRASMAPLEIASHPMPPFATAFGTSMTPDVRPTTAIPHSSTPAMAPLGSVGSANPAANSSAVIPVEQLKDEFTSFCHDKDALVAFYDELNRMGMTMSSDSGSAAASAEGSRVASTIVKGVDTPTLGASIPELGLPPNIRGRLLD